MGRLPLPEPTSVFFRRAGIVGLLIILFVAGCARDMHYKGNIDLSQYEHLKGRKIFIDPGHGGAASTDPSRRGPGSITEEAVNLRVALVLRSMLVKAGASVAMSRTKDRDVPLDKRVDDARRFSPDLIVSIHHNGSLRSADGVNYPAVLIWGSREVNARSYEFARILLDEFQKIMDEKGLILSDCSVYPETGTMILRETRYLCPGIIGECGFFTDETHAIHLGDSHYNQLEAESYFYAIASFFRQGIPAAEAFISYPDNSGTARTAADERSPVITLKLDAGYAKAKIAREKVAVAMDGLAIGVRETGENAFVLEYGARLYPGVHEFRFSFTDPVGRASQIFRFTHTLTPQKGDFDRLVSDGIRRTARKATAGEGLKMLLAALSLARTDPRADGIIWHIAKAHAMAGNIEQSRYYYARLYHCYPMSPYREKIPAPACGYRFPVEYLGKNIPLQKSGKAGGGEIRKANTVKA